MIGGQKLTNPLRFLYRKIKKGVDIHGKPDNRWYEGPESKTCEN